MPHNKDDIKTMAAKRHRHHIFQVLAIAGIAIATMISCSCEDENVAELCAKQFAQNYFNLRFKQAATLCTKSSEKWIRYHAANINSKDLDALNSQTDTATCIVDDINDNGSTAEVIITVKNFLSCDSIGKSGEMIKEAHFHLSMKKAGNTWRIDLDSPL